MILFDQTLSFKIVLFLMSLRIDKYFTTECNFQGKVKYYLDIKYLIKYFGIFF